MSLGRILYWENPNENPIAIRINSIEQRVEVGKQEVARPKGSTGCKI
jgi:hypothetical protein